MVEKVLTTKELSKYLQLNEKTILKMAQSGELPGFKIANQWRFYLSTIDEYLQDKIVRTPEYDFSRLVKTSDIIPLSRLVDEAGINLNLKSIDRDGILYELAKIAQDTGATVSAEKLSGQLIKREEMLSTAIGKGVAIPHPRNPSDDLFKEPRIIIGRSINGVDFSSSDGEKVHLFFMICAPDVVLHLKLLSKIAKLLKSKNIVFKFMNVNSKEDLIKMLLEFERNSTFSNVKITS